MTIEERLQFELRKLKAIRNCKSDNGDTMTGMFYWNIDCQIDLLSKILLGE